MSDHHSSLGVSRIDATAAERSTTAAITNPPRATGRRRSDRVISASALMQEIVDQASGIARSEEPVVLSGPSGSGRKHIARAIHQWSSRAGGPLVEIQVAGTTEPIQLRELFGDDAAGMLGALSRAQGGSLLIESADQLSGPALGRLLEGLGTGGRPRLLATVAADAESTLQGIGGHAIRLAPLSARVEDILPLAAHFLAEFAARESFDAVGFSADARRWLVEESWTGNVRELRERIRQAIRLAGNGAISAEALMLSADGDDVPSFKEAKRAFETRYVEGLLRRCSGNISRAARMAKKDRKDFYDVIRRTGVDPTQFRG